MWATILSEQEVTIQDVSKELAARGWTVVSGSIVQPPNDQLPANVMVWMLFNCTKLGRTDFPCQGLVRIATTANFDRTFFYVISHSWLIRIYYQAVMKAYMSYYKFMLRYFPGHTAE